MVKKLSYKDLETEFSNIQTEVSIKENQFNKIINSFLSKISYEIRTPMNVIVGFSNLLNDPNYNQEQKDFFIREINKNSNELLRLIDNFILSAKIETGELILNFDIHNVISMMEELNTELNKYFESQSLNISNITFKREKNKANYHIFTDKEKFLQVMITLIKRASLFNKSNLIDYGFKINDENNVDFYVEVNQGDNNEKKIKQQGEPNDNMNHNNFETVSTLGLSDKLVRLLGGNLKIKTILGQGSSYHFTIPLLVEKSV